MRRAVELVNEFRYPDTIEEVLQEVISRGRVVMANHLPAYAILFGYHRYLIAIRDGGWNRIGRYVPILIQRPWVRQFGKQGGCAYFLGANAGLRLCLLELTDGCGF